MHNAVLVGTDPEVIVIGADSLPVPAHRVGFPDKTAKMQLNGGKVFRDGYAIEINVAPSTNWYTVASRVQSVMGDLDEMLGKKQHKLLTMPAVKIDLLDLLSDAPDDVLMFGCDPSLDAYTGDAKVPDVNAMQHEYRYAGGHLHFSQPGVTTKSRHWSTRLEDAALFVRMLDLYVGLPLTMIFQREHQFQRRKYYGQAGEFRMQKYADGSVGIEYRTPGPEVWNDAVVAELACTAGQYVFANFHQLKHTWAPQVEPWVRCAINTGEDASLIVSSLGDLYTRDLIVRMASEASHFSLMLPWERKPRAGALREHFKRYAA